MFIIKILKIFNNNRQKQIILKAIHLISFTKFNYLPVLKYYMSEIQYNFIA